MPALALGRATFILLGGMALTGRTVTSVWWGVLVLDRAWLVVNRGLELDVPIFGGRGLIHYVLFSAACGWSGTLLIRYTQLSGFEKYLPGAGLITLGALQITFPWSAVLPVWYRHFAYLGVMACRTVIAIGVLFVYFKRPHIRLERVFAAALGQHVPLCSWCRAVAQRRR